MSEWLPAASAEVEKLAVPFTKLAVPRIVVPSLNVTVPLGVPPAGAVTVAVMVTAVPAMTLDGAEMVMEVATVICTVTPDEVLAAKLESPL